MRAALPSWEGQHLFCFLFPNKTARISGGNCRFSIWCCRLGCFFFFLDTRGCECKRAPSLIRSLAPCARTSVRGSYTSFPLRSCPKVFLSENRFIAKSSFSLAILLSGAVLSLHWETDNPGGIRVGVFAFSVWDGCSYQLMPSVHTKGEGHRRPCWVSFVADRKVP